VAQKTSSRGRAAPARGPRKGALKAVAAHVGATVVAAGVDALIADTGALPAGDYEIYAHAASDGVLAAGKSIKLVHRNAADNANIKELGGCAPGGTIRIYVPRITLAVNERIEWRGGSVAHEAGANARGHIEALAIPS
jgi:hypothetical protein